MAFGLPSIGTRRLRIVLAIAAPTALLGAIGLVLVLKGPPYWAGWWAVLAALLAASIPGGILLSAAVEWVIAGYRADLKFPSSAAKPS
jgi:hypothetical protein